MISVFVTFTYKDDFNESKLRQIAESAKPRFEGMPGLRSKVFTLRPEHAQEPMCTFGIPRSRPSLLHRADARARHGPLRRSTDYRIRCRRGSGRGLSVFVRGVGGPRQRGAVPAPRVAREKENYGTPRQPRITQNFPFM